MRRWSSEQGVAGAAGRPTGPAILQIGQSNVIEAITTTASGVMMTT
jgi:hypothetical protein